MLTSHSGYTKAFHLLIRQNIQGISTISWMCLERPLNSTAPTIHFKLIWLNRELKKPEKLAW